MKTSLLRIFSLVALFLISSVAAFAADPKIEFSEKSHDFGNIREEKGAVSYEFEFVNTGDAPLMIIDAKASCGCTRPSYPTEPIKPGKSGKIKVTYLPAGRPGEFNKNVKVRTNDKDNKRVTLRISGVVIPRE